MVNHTIAAGHRNNINYYNFIHIISSCKSYLSLDNIWFQLVLLLLSDFFLIFNNAIFY